MSKVDLSKFTFLIVESTGELVREISRDEDMILVVNLKTGRKFKVFPDDVADGTKQAEKLLA